MDPHRLKKSEALRVDHEHFFDTQIQNGSKLSRSVRGRRSDEQVSVFDVPCETSTAENALKTGEELRKVVHESVAGGPEWARIWLAFATFDNI